MSSQIILDQVNNQISIGGAVATAGDRQTQIYTLYGNTTSATPVVLGFASSGSGAPNSYFIASNNTGYWFDIRIVGNNTTSGGNVYIYNYWNAGWQGSGPSTFVLGNGGNIDGFNVGTVTGWSYAVTADTTNGGPKITVTGVASTNISWTATIIATKAT